MIPRRWFFSKLATFLGLSSLPVQAKEESPECKLRREKMEAKGLGPDDVRVSFKWAIEPFEWHESDMLALRVFIDAHGETYGWMHIMTPQEFVPDDTSLTITPNGVKSTVKKN